MPGSQKLAKEGERLAWLSQELLVKLKGKWEQRPVARDEDGDEF